MADLLAAQPSDELTACWAAFVAFVQDVHAPQDQLTERQWQAADRLAAAIPYPAATDEDRILALALAVMRGELDAPGLSDADWATAERMLTEYAGHVERADRA